MTTTKRTTQRLALWATVLLGLTAIHTSAADAAPPATTPPPISTGQRPLTLAPGEGKLLKLTTAPTTPILLENKACRIAFDRQTGELASIENRGLDDNILKASPKPGIPFRVYAGYKAPWLPTTDNAAAAALKLGTGSLKLMSAKSEDNTLGKSLTLNYAGEGFECGLKVVLLKDSGDSEWQLTVKNTSSQTQDAMAEFPVLDGVQLGAATAPMQQTWLNQAGHVVDAWQFPDRTYGYALEWSMQWHSVFDPSSGSALGLIIKDPDALSKKLSQHKPVIHVTYFPPRKLAPGASYTLPTTLMKVYKGDWKATARDFADWSEIAYKPVSAPQWVRELDAVNGIHFKKAGPGVAADHGGQWVLDSFRNIPEAHIGNPAGLTEYAFWCRGSMLYGKHTDGDNMIREDMGGAEAMREGIASVHKLGLRASLYIEGYIVAQKSELAKEGKAQRWQVINADGGTVGSPHDYTVQGFYMMCPGCVEWQDHLANVAIRVMKETGADGIRLDSLGFSYRNCYNPAHQHESPYDFNQWMKQLLSKVEKAVHSVNPDAIFWTEGPVDFYSSYSQTALTQFKFHVDDVPPMRIAMKAYRPLTGYAGCVWASLAGLAGGKSQWERDIAVDEANWYCAQYPVHDALVWGEVCENPASSDSEIRTRHFANDACDVLVAARPEQQGASWGDFCKLSAKRAAYDLHLPQAGLASPDVAICDIEKLEWTSVKPENKDGTLVVPGVSNWMLVVVPKPGHRVVSFDALPSVKAGAELAVKTYGLAGENPGAKLEVIAPGLSVSTPENLVEGQSFKIRAPDSAFPGLYEVCIKGKNVIGIRRYLKVVK